MQLFDVAFGRNLLREIPQIVNSPYLIVAAKDLWPSYEENFEGSAYTLYTPESLEIEDLEKSITELPEFKSVVGFGGGVAIDVAKYIAWRKDLPLFQVPTSMSVNAPFAQRAAVRENGILRYVGFKRPEMVYVDYDVIQSAPKFINRSGVGDIFCYYTAHWDYRYAVEKGKVEAKWPLEEEWVAEARSVLDSVLDGATEINKVSDKGIRILMNALRWGGAAFNNNGWNPRPIEGSEHTFFYSLEHLTNRPYLHGQIVSLGVLLMSYLQNHDPEFIKGKLDEIGVAYQPEDMGITWEQVRDGLKHMRDYSQQSGNLWYTIATETEITDKYLDEVQAWISGR
jgi:glycerol dehydrogenase-like iron-containing ADH family enzyme